MRVITTHLMPGPEAGTGGGDGDVGPGDSWCGVGEAQFEGFAAVSTGVEVPRVGEGGAGGVVAQAGVGEVLGAGGG